MSEGKFDPSEPDCREPGGHDWRSLEDLGFNGPSVMRRGDRVISTYGSKCDCGVMAFVTDFDSGERKVRYEGERFRP